MCVFSSLQSWQLVSMGSVQCGLQRWNKEKNKEGHSGTKLWRCDLSSSGRNNGLQYQQVQRYSSQLLSPLYTKTQDEYRALEQNINLQCRY